MLFINCDEAEQKVGFSSCNQSQVNAIGDILALFLKQGYDFSKFGFASPYRAQDTLLKEKLRNLKNDGTVSDLLS